MNQKRNQNFENTLLKQTLLFCFVLSQCMSHLGLNLNIYIRVNILTLSPQRGANNRYHVLPMIVNLTVVVPHI